MLRNPVYVFSPIYPSSFQRSEESGYLCFSRVNNMHFLNCYFNVLIIILHLLPTLGLSSCEYTSRCVHAKGRLWYLWSHPSVSLWDIYNPVRYTDNKRLLINLRCDGKVTLRKEGIKSTNDILMLFDMCFTLVNIPLARQQPAKGGNRAMPERMNSVLRPIRSYNP